MSKIFQTSLSSRSRTLLRTASLLFVAYATTGCVAAKHYDEARSVAESEAQAHTLTRERLVASLERIDKLEADLAAREKALASNASEAEESKLAGLVAGKEKEAAFQLVEQLRSELARTGDHLVLFATEKRDLGKTLLLAEERMRDIEAASKGIGELVAVVRDLALALPTELDKHVVELGARDGQVVLSMTSERLFAPNGDALVMDAGPVLSAVGTASGQHPNLRVIVREPAGAPLSNARMTRLGEALRQSGVAEARLVLPQPRAEVPAPVADETATLPAEGAPGEAPVATEPAAPKPPAPLPMSAPAPVDPQSLRYEIAFAL